jgi:eukaryotic-like serine/threonine-protein kinase
MDATRWELAQSLFHQAVSMPPAERHSFLHSSCGGDNDLLREVLEMLVADEGGPSFLDSGLEELAGRVVGAPSDVHEDREFGPYKLIRLLGEGGMGVVWLARRQDTEAHVAIKFLPNSNLSPARRARFTREIKTLAKLKHPYIARLYDAGSLSDGTPWFVMEYVEGLNLAEYLRESAPAITDSLKLFRKICEAVQYAHSQVIIHRDLKPTNILVEQDGTPRLLDFGIARELQGLNEFSDKTQPGLRFLSLQYAAPEWINEGTVGFTTDVYSLGVILYELLTGRLPVDRVKSITESDRGERATERPSVAMSNHGSLSKTARADLDVLCLKALRNDPKERYQSVEALLRDVNHFLSGEPLEARPATLRYRANKFIRRNSRAVLAASIAFATIVGLVIFFTVRLAVARNAALAEAARTQRVLQFMFGLFKGNDDEAGPPEDLRVVTVLDRGVERAQALGHDPEIQAEVFRTLGGSYEQLGKFDRASQLLDSALKLDRASLHPNDLSIADDLQAIALLHSDQDDYKVAEALARESLQAVQHHRPLDPVREAKATATLGRVLNDSGNYKEASRILNQAVDLLSSREPSSIDLSETVTLLADAELSLGHYETADSLNRRALKIDRRIFGDKHPTVSDDLINLGQLQEMWGHYAQAEQYDRQSLQMTKDWYGPDHPDTARKSVILAQTLTFEGRNDEAEALILRALPVEQRVYGDNSPHVGNAMNMMGKLAQQKGNLDDAEMYFRKAADIYRSKLGDNYKVAVAISNLGGVYSKRKDYSHAEQFFREALQNFAADLPPDNINVGIVKVKLGRALLGEHRYREAEEQSRAGYEILIKQTSPTTDFVKGAREDLAAIYTALGQPEKAQVYLATVAEKND